jgi:AcrR family transcriptional regulator
MIASPSARARRSGKRPADTLSTRVMILNEAERLIAQKGVFGFTLDDVAAPLKVRVPSIYKHFASRDDVLVEVSKRFIGALSLQFAVPDDMARDPRAALKGACDAFVDFHVANPAYVRLSLVDLATPQGGMEYVKRAAGGPFQANFRSGPLAPMHRHLAQLLSAGQRAREFRKVPALDFYRLLKSALLIRLVFPDDQLQRARRSTVRVRRIKNELWDLAARYLAIGAGAL